LLRAVNECDFPPIKSEWENYLIELAMLDTGEDGRLKKVEQVDLITGATIATWDSVTAASRALKIPSHVITAVLKSKADHGGGFKWRYCRPTGSKEEVND